MEEPAHLCKVVRISFSTADIHVSTGPSTTTAVAKSKLSPCIPRPTNSRERLRQSKDEEWYCHQVELCMQSQSMNMEEQHVLHFELIDCS